MIDRTQALSEEIVDTSPFVEFGERHLTFREDTPYEVWSEVVGRLKNAEKSIQWWLGDAIRFGERKYGEMYSQALEVSDYSYGALRDAAWVAGRIELSRRRDNLSYTHHREVAALEPEEQERLLEAAIPLPGENQPKLSTRALREKVSEMKTLPVEEAKRFLDESTKGEVGDVEVVDGSAIVKIVKARNIEYVVKFGDGASHTVPRKTILEQGWKKCKGCKGHGVTRPEGETNG